MSDDISSKTPRPVKRRFTQLVDALDRAKARYAICGATAMGAHGVRRFTEDIDVLVDAADVDRVITELSTTMIVLGRQPETGVAKQVRMRAKRAKGPSAVDVVLMVPVDAIEAWALATSVPTRAFEREVDVASLEALVLMKLRAYVSDPDSRRGPQHRADAITLVQTTRVDVPALRRFLRGHTELAAELERVLASPPPRGRVG